MALNSFSESTPMIMNLFVCREVSLQCTFSYWFWYLWFSHLDVPLVLKRSALIGKEWLHSLKQVKKRIDIQWIRSYKCADHFNLGSLSEWSKWHFRYSITQRRRNWLRFRSFCKQMKFTCVRSESGNLNPVKECWFSLFIFDSQINCWSEKNEI